MDEEKEEGMRRQKKKRRGNLEGEDVVRKGRDRVVVRLEERGREKRFFFFKKNVWWHNATLFIIYYFKTYSNTFIHTYITFAEAAPETVFVGFFQSLAFVVHPNC